MFIIDIMMAISNWLWGWPLLILTSAVAVYLSVRFKFFQFTRFGHAMKNTFGKIFDKGDGEGDISPFQACCTALASTLGVGNIAGVSVAIATGGPGAVFWMWAVALMGFIVKFSEITLGMAYRERDPGDRQMARWLLLVCAPGAGQELEVAGHFLGCDPGLRHGVCARRAGQLCGGGDSGLL